MAHRCNAYCREGEHAEVVWCLPPHLAAPGTTEDELRYHCDTWHMTYLRHRPAPEARRDRDLGAFTEPMLLTFKEA